MSPSNGQGLAIKTVKTNLSNKPWAESEILIQHKASVKSLWSQRTMQESWLKKMLTQLFNLRAVHITHRLRDRGQHHIRKLLNLIKPALNVLCCTVKQCNDIVKKHLN